MLKKVLLGIGGTPFTDVAIRRAVELCQIHDAQLTAVTVVDQRRLKDVGPVPVGGSAAAVQLRAHRIEATRERVEEAVEKLKAACEESKVQVAIHREEGQPFQLMVDYARYHDVSIFGLRSMFEYDVLGSSDVAPADVLSRLVIGGVRPIIAVSERFRPIRRVLIAYSGSVRSAETMKQFIRLGPWPDVTLRILACGGDEANAERWLSDAVAYCRQHGHTPERAYREGPPGPEILSAAASWDADLIVLGMSRGNILSRAVFGSTALHVLRNADRPLYLGR